MKKSSNIKISKQDIAEIPLEKKLILKERLERQMAKDNYVRGIQGVDGGRPPGCNMNIFGE